MPNYYNPYNFYPVQYANQMGYSGMNMAPQAPAMMPQQSMAQQPQLKAMEWVEGEVGAKAFQMPAGWPANQPIPLWDSTDTIIWLKSWGPMGIPNPMQKLKYVMPEQQSQNYLMSGNVGNDQNANMSGNTEHHDVSNFATKDDITSLREEIRNMQQSTMSHMNNQNQSGNNMNPGNQNGSQNNSGNNNQNRGGNR